VVDGQRRLEDRVGVRPAVLAVHQVGELGQPPRDHALPRAQVRAPALPALRLPPQGGLASAGDGLPHLLRAVHRVGAEHLPGRRVERVEGVRAGGRVG
jgi:hypothetical protein